MQPVDRPILCNPYEEPRDHWIYDKETGAASRAGTRRPASYWYKTERTGSAQLTLTGLAEEERDDLPLVNALREDVRKWRDARYPGTTNVTRDLLRHWARTDRGRRLFFCQIEAVETIIYLQEIRFPGKVGIRGNPKLGKEDLNRMLAGERPSFTNPGQDFFPRLVDPAQDASLAALRRIACKMATGSGKTVVMSMVVAWAFCNRGQNPATTLFPNGVLICCPNLTVRERLQMLRPKDLGPLGNHRGTLGQLLRGVRHRSAQVPRAAAVRKGAGDELAPFRARIGARGGWQELCGGEQGAGDAGYLCAPGAGRPL